MERIIVIGLGGYGMKFMKHFEDKAYPSLQCITIDEQPREEKSSFLHLVVENSEDHFIQHEDIQHLLENCQGAKQVYLVAGAGGSYGTYRTLCLANSFAKADVPFTILFTKPFSFEGSQKELEAHGMEQYIHEMGYAYLSLENNEIRQFFRGEQETMSLQEAFKKADEPFLTYILQHEKEQAKSLKEKVK